RAFQGQWPFLQPTTRPCPAALPRASLEPTASVRHWLRPRPRASPCLPPRVLAPLAVSRPSLRPSRLPFQPLRGQPPEYPLSIWVCRLLRASQARVPSRRVLVPIREMPSAPPLRPLERAPPPEYPPLIWVCRQRRALQVLALLLVSLLQEQAWWAQVPR